MRKPKPLDQQVVVIVGASSGIGRAAALRVAAGGAKVVAAARSEEGLRTLVDEIGRRGGAASYRVADVADPAQVRAVAAHAVATFGRIDTWVHCAGVALFAPFEATAPDEFRRMVEVNLNGQAYGAMAALPHLKGEGGALVLVSSMGAVRGVPFQTAYIASKHGVKGFAESLRVELVHRQYPVSVTNILPASINTPLFDKARTKLGVKPVAPPPLYQPAIVAEAIAYAATHRVRHLVVGGSARAIILAARLPRAELAVIPGAGHVPHLERPAETAAALQQFFEGAGGAARGVKA